MNFNYLFNPSLTFSVPDRLHNWTTNKKYFCLSVFLIVGGTIVKKYKQSA